MGTVRCCLLESSLARPHRLQKFVERWHMSMLTGANTQLLMINAPDNMVRTAMNVETQRDLPMPIPVRGMVQAWLETHAPERERSVTGSQHASNKSSTG